MGLRINTMLEIRKLKLMDRIYTNKYTEKTKKSKQITNKLWN